MLFIFLFGFLCVATQGEVNLIVSTSSGILKGTYGTVLDKPMKMFLGVPYAVPPVGDLRFKAPALLHTKGIERSAENFAPICLQPPHVAEVISPLLKPNQAEISEDCLYLNIYVPDDHNLGSLPVMVWLAGEGFNYADPHQFDGSYLAVEGKIILVTVSYRLSVFGFLSALHDDAPGNVGLLDQRAALRWVQDNIANFTGDPHRVTLFGRFTGAMSAAIHAFSPLSKEEELFQRVILHSGVPDGDWVFDRNPLNATFSLAKATNCESSTLAETIECFKRIDANNLLKAALPIPNAWRPILDFTLVRESTLKAAAKLNYNPIAILIGLNKDEGALCLTALKAMKSDYFGKIVEKTLNQEDFGTLIKNSLNDVFKTNSELVQKFTSFVYSDFDQTKLRDKFVQFCGDLYINAHSEKLADIVSRVNSSVYVYELTHRPSFSNQPDFITAAHGDDVLYAFGLPLSLESLPQEEDTLTRQILDAISNFAYYGNPNEANATVWPAYTTENRLIRNFDILLNHEEVQKSTHEDAVLFWHDIVPSALNRSCSLPSMASALVDFQEHEQGNPGRANFLGMLVTIPTAEYMMLGLVFSSGLLLVVAFLSIVAMLRIKHHATFHRLK